MRVEGRISNFIKNITAAFLFQLLNIILKFILRTIFISTLGKEYLGVAGVFSNILTVLSLAELGIGTAIVYDMYKPLAEGNTYRVTQLFRFYKKVYYTIGIIISCIGILLIPLLPYILSDITNVEHVYVLYILHLTYSVSSYFFAQYTSLFNANQLNRVISKNSMLISFVKTLVEAIVLILIGNYIIYLVIEIVISIFGNYIVFLKAKKFFPYITHKTRPLDSNSKKKIFTNSMYMLNIRIGGILINATDNIIISAFISTILVGIYSNYTMITQIILTTTVLIENSLISAIGNFCATNENNKEMMFRSIRYVFSVIYCIIATCLYVLLNPFVEIWLGDEYLLEKVIVLLITMNVYLSGIHQPVEAFINADGLFKYFRVKPIIEVIINLIVSIIGARIFGLFGVLLGTIISHASTTLWFDGYVVYRFSLKGKFKSYIIHYVKWFFVMISAVFAADFLAVEFLPDTIIGFVFKMIVCIIIPIVLCLVFSCGTLEYAYIRNKVEVFLGRKIL